MDSVLQVFQYMHFFNRVICFEHGRTCHQYVGTSLYQLLAGLAVDATVNFNQRMRVGAVNQLTQPAGLVE